MRQITSKHTIHGRKRHDFISLFTIFLLSSGLLALIYLLSFCHLPDGGQTFLIRSVSAREQARGSQISDAIFLSKNTAHQISLSPHNHRYYYVKFQNNFSVQIVSGSPSIKLTFYSDRGRRLTIPKKDNSYPLEKISGNLISCGDRIFLKFTNTSADSCVVKVQYRKAFVSEAAKNKQATPKSKKTATTKKAQTVNKTTQTTKKTSQTTGKADETAQTTAKTSQTTGKADETAQTTAKTARTTGKASSLGVNPHFMRLTCGSRKKLSLTMGRSSLALADCTYFSTDTSVISVHNDRIIGKKPGTAILYFKQKKSAACGSCLVRVTVK